MQALIVGCHIGFYELVPWVCNPWTRFLAQCWPALMEAKMDLRSSKDDRSRHEAHATIKHDSLPPTVS